MNITKEWLKKHSACAEGVRFFECNFPNGLDTDKVTVKGDFGRFWSWLRRALACTFEYDNNSKMIKAFGPNGGVWSYEYDDNGNMIKMVDPYRNQVSYEYNAKGECTKEIWSNGEVAFYEYDDDGKMVKAKDRNGVVANFEYDQKGNIIAEIGPYGTWSYNYGYDEKTRLFEIRCNSARIASIYYHD